MGTSTANNIEYSPNLGFKRYKPTLRSFLRTSVPKDERETLPIDHVGLCSISTGSWMTSLLWNIFRKGSSAVVKYQCPTIDSCQFNVRRMEHLWQDELNKQGPENASLYRAVHKFLRTRQTVMIAMFTIAQCIGFFTPVIFTYELLEYSSNPDIPLFDGLKYVFAILLTDGMRMFLFSFLWNINSRTAVRLRSALLGTIFRKVVALQSLGDKSVGEVINLFANDGTRILEYVILGQLWIAGTIVSVMCMAYVFWAIGLPALSGLAVFVFFYLVQYLAGRLNGYYRKKAIFISDQRVRQMTEILVNMKVIKVYAWEESFTESVMTIRNKERSFLEKVIFLQSVMNSFSTAIPIVASIVTFLTCFAMEVELPASKAFPVLGAFIISRTGLMILSGGVAKIAEFQTSVQRMQSVLLMNNGVTHAAVPRDPNHAVCLMNASFAWNTTLPPQNGNDQNKFRERKLSSWYRDHRNRNGAKKEDEEKQALAKNQSSTKRKIFASLSDIDLVVPKGRLVGVCGTVGSGKSSLISAILGQMQLLRGTLATDGMYAYVAQQAWIMNATVKDNILFGTQFDSRRYELALECCCLMDDIKSLAAGDQTEIGERGVNLSGGQKQRISLARAVYSDRDLYLLDDPLSAVDYTVGAQILQKCIKTALALKTVIFVSHQVQYLSHCEYILVMKDGRIIEQGNPIDLINLEGEYATLIQAYNEETENGKSPIDEQMKNVTSLRPDEIGQQETSMSNHTEEEREAGKNITIEEKLGSGGISRKTYLTYIRAMGGPFAALIIFLIIGGSTFILAFSNWWLSVMLSSRNTAAARTTNNETLMSTDGGYEDHNLQRDSIIYGCFLLAIFGSTCIKAISYVKGTLRASTVLHQEMLQKVIHSPMSFFETVPAGRTINAFSKDQDEVDTVLPIVMEITLNLMWLNVITVLLIVLVFPWFLLPLVVIVGLYCLAANVFKAAQTEMKRSENASRSPLFSHIGAMIQGLSTIHAYEKERDFERRFVKLQDENSSIQLLLLMAPRWLSLRLDLLTVSTLTATATFVVFSRGIVPPAFAGLALTCCFQLAGVVHYLVRNMAETEARFTNVERIVRYCETLKCEGSEVVDPNEAPTNWPSAGRIAFEDVQMRYREGLPLALSSVSFCVEAGQKIGIVGRTGSGKSSLGAVLFRLVELCGGKIVIDGVDIARLRLKDLRSRLSMIPQDPVLFIGTVRYNLDPFEHFADEDIWKVLERTHLKEKVSSFEQQLLAPVAENGENFSVGERQLLCLARALLRHSKIIILDEATASVDTHTDALIQDILQEAFKDCTVLTVAHRIQTVLNYDRILVMHQGKVQEFGSPQQLRSNKESLFRKLLEN